ncbi:hypothetical protein L0Y34_01870 [Candidatus Parcubacteria bacterium]|nr:hypothetical protein [Candidatus Parcubacteria bacterium]
MLASGKWTVAQVTEYFGVTDQRKETPRADIPPPAPPSPNPRYAFNSMHPSEQSEFIARELAVGKSLDDLKKTFGISDDVISALPANAPFKKDEVSSEPVSKERRERSSDEWPFHIKDQMKRGETKAEIPFFDTTLLNPRMVAPKRLTPEKYLELLAKGYLGWQREGKQEPPSTYPTKEEAEEELEAQRKR